MMIAPLKGLPADRKWGSLKKVFEISTKTRASVPHHCVFPWARHQLRYLGTHQNDAPFRRSRNPKPKLEQPPLFNPLFPLFAY